MSQISSLPKSIPTILHNTSTHTFTLVEDHRIPEPSPTQYLILVHATTFTASETLWPEPNSLQNPIPGFDLSGTVLVQPSASPPSGTTHHPAGTRVFALTSFSRRGNARTITVAEHGELPAIPAALSFTEAASVPLSALTAWQVLFVPDHAALEAKESADANRQTRVLVTAASGGVGVWAVQLAAWAGCYVVGTSGTANLEFVKSLGAKEVLDYREINLVDWVDHDAADRAFDVVIDCVGGETLEDCWRVVKPGGILTSVAEPAEGRKPECGFAEDVKSFWFIVDPNAEQLGRIGDLITKGKVKPIVDSVWNFENYVSAWKRVVEGRVRGKVVLQVRSDT